MLTTPGQQVVIGCMQDTTASCHFGEFLSSAEKILGSMPDWRCTAFWHNSSFQVARTVFWKNHMTTSPSRMEALMQQIRCACLQVDAIYVHWAC